MDCLAIFFIHILLPKQIIAYYIINLILLLAKSHIHSSFSFLNTKLNNNYIASMYSKIGKLIYIFFNISDYKSYMHRIFLTLMQIEN